MAFPADMADEDIDAIMQQRYGAQTEQPVTAQPEPRKVTFMGPDPAASSKPKTMIGNALRALDSVTTAVEDFPPIRGMKDIPDGAAQFLINGIDKLTGGDGNDEEINNIIQQNEKRYQQKYGDSKLATLGRIGGQIFGTLPLAGSGGATALSRTLQGAKVGGATGILQPVTEGDYWEEKGKDVAIGTAGGAVAPHLIKGVANVVGGAKNKAAQALHEAGVKLTPGQALGGAWKRTEEKLTSIPILGDAIRHSYERGHKTFNEAIARRVLEPIGKSPTNGTKSRDLVADVHRQISSAYDEVLPKIRVTLDDQFTDDINSIRVLAAEYSDDLAKKYQKIIGEKVLNRFQNGHLDGKAFKKAESELSRVARNHTKSADADQNELASLLGETKVALGKLLDRGTGAMDAKRSIDEAYSRFLIFQKAAGSVADEGSVTPAQYLNAVKAQDYSKHKGRFARGQAKDQEFAEQAKGIMVNEIPNSGTVDRYMIGGSLGMGAIEPTTFGTVTLPAIGALGGMSLPYLSKIQDPLVSALLKRPESAVAAGKMIEGSIQPSNVAIQRLMQTLMEQ